MLAREENELLTRVGPDTPMGNTMRRYWIPALLARELPEPELVSDIGVVYAPLTRYTPHDWILRAGD